MRPSHPLAPVPPKEGASRRQALLPGWAAAGVRIALALLGTIAALGLVGAMVLGITISLIYSNLPDIGSIVDYQPRLPMRLYTADGVLLGEVGKERREFTPIAEIPKVMQNAVLAFEDARFYQHGGVDFIGLARAAVAQIRDPKSQGGSTITMQVARNFYLSTEKTFIRKIYEILLTWKIESKLSKSQILELYMNQIFLGQHSYGFAAASHIYFGKSLQDVTIAEAAMLAALPRAPSAYNPLKNPDLASRQQHRVIDRMLFNGFITAAQADAARKEVLHYDPPPEHLIHGGEYAVDAARQLIFDQYHEDAYTRGLNVYLTINSEQQEAAYRALRKGVMDYERRQVYRGPAAYVDLPAPNAEDIDLRIAEALSDQPADDDLLAAVVLEASPRKVVAALESDKRVTITGDGLKLAASALSDKAGLKTQIRRGAVIRVQLNAKNEWSINQQPEVEGAIVAIDPRSGAVRAMVGGLDYDKSQFNRVTQAWRQPGSSFKPFIYSAALEKGFTPATIINDAPLFFDAGTTGSQPWAPKNYDGTFDGPITMRRALAKSKNMVSIRILQSIGPAYAQQWISRFGFDPERHPPYLTMALGAGSVTPLQMALAYSVFANGGFRVNPSLIAKITDAKGHVLSETVPAVLDESTRAVAARNAFLMTSLLQEVTRSGTAARAQAMLKRPDIYGKTGTTNGSTDTWFAGWQSNLATVVWLGYDNPKKLGDRETGSSLSLPIWIDFMGFALKNVPVDEQAPAPPGIVNVGGEWFYEEFSQGAGVGKLGTEDKPPTEPSDAEEKKSILDLFR